MSAPISKKRDNNITGFVRQYGKGLFGFIRNRVPSNADAEDILQEVWYQLSNVVDLDSIEQMIAWLFRVARNRITDNYRKKKEEALEDLVEENGEGDLNFSDLFLAEFPQPEDDELRELFWEELFKALDELPEKQRNVFVWNELEDQTFREISERTGDNIKTLISRKRYAVQHLRNRLEELYEELLNIE